MLFDVSTKRNTKQLMIEAAFELFHERGVHASSVDAILERSATGKSQFSHYFKNKDGLVLAVLTHFSEQMKSGAYSKVESIESWDDLETFLRSFIQWQNKVECTLSCPIGTIGHDLTKEQKELRRTIKEIFDWRRTYVADFFKEEQAMGRLKKDTSPEVLADFCYTIIQGGLWMAKIERTTKPFKNAIDTALTYLYSLRTPEKKSRPKSGTTK